ncbi:hypothetical protein HWV62_2607 [Athelia sp. TMB]|nr:hypothetical protein HWV62_2607 [Athelia sp. TMB]
MASPLEIAAPSATLPTCSPHLMPFHINYSGLAPIATYFRIKPTTLLSQSAGIAGLEAQAQEAVNIDDASQNTLVESQSQSQTDVHAAMDTTEDKEAVVNHVPTPSLPPLPAPTPKKTKTASLGERFKAAFRGRSVHGVTVNLPEGYGGIVLRAPTNVGRKTQVRPAKDGRSKRGRGKNAAEMDVDIEENEEEAAREQEQEAVRRLLPSATFASFVLWAPDAPVDEARDEYLRALTEWTALAEEIHRVED